MNSAATSAATTDYSPDAIECLDAINFWLSTYDGKELWDVLVALRGPDNFGPSRTRKRLKQSITAIIRHHALPASESLGNVVAHADTKKYARIRRELTAVAVDPKMRHFISHARKAFAALELKWDEVNT